MCLSIFFYFFVLNALSNRRPPPWSAHLCPPLSGSFFLSLYIYKYFSLASHSRVLSAAAAAAALIRWILFESLQGRSWMCPPGGFRNQ